jgi:hypothetical protein
VVEAEVEHAERVGASQYACDFRDVRAIEACDAGRCVAGWYGPGEGGGLLHGHV